MIISLHLPKTAGTSFKKSLEAHFGPTLLSDYGDLPINKPAYDRHKAALTASIEIGKRGLPGVECVHGHFLPLKYLLLSTKQELNFVTWMRDPVERMLSHYYYWQRSYDPKTSAHLHKKVVEEGWTLEQFCLSPQFKNLYSQFLWGFPLERFDFIGITEFYKVELNYFSRNYLSSELTPYHENVANNKLKKHSIDSGLLKKIEMYHKNDIELYQRALEMQRARGCGT